KRVTCSTALTGSAALSMTLNPSCTKPAVAQASRLCPLGMSEQARRLLYEMKGFFMRHTLLPAVLIATLAAPSIGQEHAIVAQPKPDPATAHFDAVLRQALTALIHAGSYAVDVESQWGAAGDPNGSQG